MHPYHYLEYIFLLSLFSVGGSSCFVVVGARGHRSELMLIGRQCFFREISRE